MSSNFQLQLKDLLQTFAVMEVPPEPDPRIIALLNEISKSNSEVVQLECVRLFQLLLTRFPQLALVRGAAESICGLFSGTSWASVAVACILSFKGLNPLQFKLFDGVRLLQRMTNVPAALTRFSADSQGKLLEAFKSVADLLGDEDLMEEVAALGSAGRLYVREERGEGEEIEGEADKGKDKDKDKGLDIVRVRALLQSEDRAVRLFGLQKLKRLLQDRDKGVAATLSADGIVDLAQVTLAALKKAMQGRNTADRPNPNPNPSPNPALPVAGRLVAAALTHVDSDAAAVLAALDALCTLSLPHSPSPSPSRSSAGLPRNRGCRSLLTGRRLSAEELVMSRPLADWARLLLTLAHADLSLLLPPPPPLSAAAAARAGSDSDRTLTAQQRTDIAERSAYLFGLTLTSSAVPQVWQKVGLQLEATAIAPFLELGRVVGRLSLALTYLVSMLPPARKERERVGDAASGNGLLLSTLLREGGRVMARLWQLVGDTLSLARPPRRVRIMALLILAEMSACSQVRSFLRSQRAATR